MVHPSGDGVNTRTGEIWQEAPQRLGLSNAHICTPSRLTYAPAGRLCVLGTTAEEDVTRPGGQRAEISVFSRQSRKRLMQLFASLDEEAVAHRCVFVTLTYHRRWPKTPEGWQEHLRCFLQRFLRKYPECAVIWRLEFQLRGAPHFHLLALNRRRIDKDWLTLTWGDIAHQGSEYRGEHATKVERPRNWRQACSYVSKYMAKPSTTALPPRTGRFWGVRNRDRLPSAVETVQLSQTTWDRMKALLIAKIGADKLSLWVRMTGAGIWTMQSAGETFHMLAYASQEDLPLADYSPPTASP